MLAVAATVFDFSLHAPWIRWGMVTLMGIYAYLDTRYKNSAVEFYKYGMVGTGIEKPTPGGDRGERAAHRGIAKGWRKLPPETLQALQNRLGPNFERLDYLARKYNIFREQVFSGALNESPEMFVSLAMPMFLGSMGAQLAAQAQQVDGEGALRLSLQLKPGGDNPSHVGLALVLAQLGRLGEAASEARIGLETMDKLDREMGSAAESTRTMFGFEGPDIQLRSQLVEIIRTAEDAGDSPRPQQSVIERTPDPIASEKPLRSSVFPKCPKCGSWHRPDQPCGFLPGRL
jgi:hypothetical protein